MSWRVTGDVYSTVTLCAVSTKVTEESKPYERLKNRWVSYFSTQVFPPYFFLFFPSSPFKGPCLPHLVWGGKIIHAIPFIKTSQICYAKQFKILRSYESPVIILYCSYVLMLLELERFSAARRKYRINILNTDGILIRFYSSEWTGLMFQWESLLN